MSQSIIELINVKKSFNTAQGTFDALKGVSIDFSKGEFISVVGKSGSGKSTLMNMIGGIDRPTSGEIIADGIGIHELDENKTAKWRGKNVGVVFQFFQLMPTLTILENVMLPMDFCNSFPSSSRKERAFMLLRQMGVEEQANKLPSSLSGGQQQRAAIARALANDPSIILADEPTGNLDSSTAQAVFDIFSGLSSNGKTVIIVTHDQELAERCDRKIKIADGNIVE